ncbi:MAG TPA: SH3 domain-containing protein [Anaerolineae bacterium]|nr:SH3 domain-containing protein [Anaerolineae bacterium]
MKHKWPVFWFLVFLMVPIVACGGVGQSTPIPPPPAVPTVATGTPGVAATVTLPGTAGPTGPTVKTLVNLNVRSGPGTNYPVIGFLLEGELSGVVGVDPATGWWKITCPVNATSVECWVTNLTQYVEASGTSGVAVAAVPPTPTPVPPTATPIPPTATPPAGPQPFHLAYLNKGDVWLRELVVDGSQVTSSGASQMTVVGDVGRVLLSGDGAWIAYVGGSQANKYLAVVGTDGQNGRVLVQARDLYQDEGVNTVFGDMYWLDDQLTLVFNTYRTAGDLRGAVSNDDLWSVRVDGGLVSRFVRGQGGGRFVMMGNQVVLATKSEVVRVGLDGSNRETVVTYPEVTINNVMMYYPALQAVGNSNVLVAVADPDLFDLQSPGVSPVITLWQVPTTGGAIGLTSMAGNVAVREVKWSGNGRYLAYLPGRIGDPSALSHIMIANGDGTDVVRYGEENVESLFGWNPSGTSFLYRIASGHGIGFVNQAPIIVSAPPGQNTLETHWLNNDVYLYIQGVTNGWNFKYGDVTGQTGALFGNSDSFAPAFDIAVK